MGQQESCGQLGGCREEKSARRQEKARGGAGEGVQGVSCQGKWSAPRLGQRGKKGSRLGKKCRRDQLERLVKVLRQVSFVKVLCKYFDKERTLIALQQDEAWRRAVEESQRRGGVLGRSCRWCL